MSSTTTKKLLTADEFAKLPNPIDGSKEELVRGEIVTRPAPSFIHGFVKGLVGFALQTFASETHSGRVVLSTGIITEHSPDTVRGLDVAFWSFERLPAEHVPVVYANVPADLCVEVRSSNNTDAKITRKVREYLASGVRLVWVVDPVPVHGLI